MNSIRLVTIAAVVLWTSDDLLACGDKFLVGGRGTRYQRPKNFRAAAVLVYSNPSAALPAPLGKVSVESALTRVGHRPTTARTAEQLSALLAGGRYDIVLAGSDVTAAVEKLLGASTAAPVVVSFCVQGAASERARRSCAVKVPFNERTLLEAIDKAVVQRDRRLRSTLIVG